jgi:hypothetical protein
VRASEALLAGQRACPHAQLGIYRRRLTGRLWNTTSLTFLLGYTLSCAGGWVRAGLRCAEQLVEWIMPGCEVWLEGGWFASGVASTGHGLRMRAQLEAQSARLLVLRKAVELSAAARQQLSTGHAMPTSQAFRECDDEAYQVGGVVQTQHV